MYSLMLKTPGGDWERKDRLFAQDKLSTNFGSFIGIDTGLARVMGRDGYTTFSRVKIKDGMK